MLLFCARSPLALRSSGDAATFVLLSAAGHSSLFPLLFQSAGEWWTLMKALLHSKSWPVQNRWPVQASRWYLQILEVAVHIVRHTIEKHCHHLSFLCACIHLYLTAWSMQYWFLLYMLALAVLTWQHYHFPKCAVQSSPWALTSCDPYLYCIFCPNS